MMHKGFTGGRRLQTVWPIDEVSTAPAEDGPLALLRSVGAKVRRYAVPLGLWTGLCILAAGLYAYTAVPIYSATATLLLEPRRGVSRGVGEQAGAGTLDLNRADSELQVIRSERLLNAVFEGLGLAEKPEFLPQGGAAVGNLANWLRRVAGSQVRGGRRAVTGENPGENKGAGNEASSPAPDAALTRQVAFENFARRLTARRVGQSYVVEITYSSSDPALAAQVANAAASAYIWQSVSFKAELARNGAENLQGRVNALDAQVEAAGRALNEGVVPAGPTPDADARVIGAALRPLAPSAPRKTLILLLGAIGGLMSGLMVAALVGAFDRKLRGSGDLPRQAGLPCLASIPQGNGGRGARRRSEAEMERLAVTHPTSAYALAVRRLRTAVALACSASRPGENMVVAFVACDTGAGTTTLVMNLARVIGRSGTHVTVLNTEGPDRYELQGGGAVTVVDALAHRALPAQLSCFRLDDVSVLPLLSATEDLNHFADFNDPCVDAMIDAVRQKGDVLLNLPPVGSEMDTLALAQHADAVILVAVAGSTRIDEVAEAARSLRAGGANVIGAVLSNAAA
ncbi:exopolysaccharide biosynthesis protein [Bosea sp. NBC_00550]|uniref:exopolysaccharide biosynthesis protein n=1 Tax=Bosea sp. NBC_00550 TaxID=2969621 RepID=UPI00223073F3|nr:exopolysaccharide biosynthesis protein [Bosea sp. NBC_00550]UZF91754.1 exopolysaccharide biosynthesis protein [Bosea sp. NBC_00550]